MQVICPGFETETVPSKVEVTCSEMNLERSLKHDPPYYDSHFLSSNCADCGGPFTIGKGKDETWGGAAGYDGKWICNGCEKIRNQLPDPDPQPVLDPEEYEAF